MREEALRTIWLSDVHLGSPSCRVNLLLDFLRQTHCELLYLVGDIIDIESLRRSFYWPASHTEVLRLLLKKSQEGTRVIYIPGNHDDDLRALVGMRFGNIEVLEETIHTTSEGRRLLVTHGDQFDAVVRGRSLGVLLGGLACRGLLTLNRFVHWLHDLANRPYWSLAQHVKSRFPARRATSSVFSEPRSSRRVKHGSTVSSAVTSTKQTSPQSKGCSTATTAIGWRAARPSSRIRRANCRS